MKKLQFLKLSLLLLLIVGLSACQSMNGTVGTVFGLDTDLQIDFEVDADINPDDLGIASPLFIRMYELKSRKMMEKAGFIDLYERDKEVLGADLITVHNLKHFEPGESRTEHFVIAKNANYVVLYAEFLAFKDAKFKLIIPVVANNVFRNSVIIRVSGNKLLFDQPVDEDLYDEGSQNGNDGGDGDGSGSSAMDKLEKAKGGVDGATESATKVKGLFN